MYLEAVMSDVSVVCGDTHTHTHLTALCPGLSINQSINVKFVGRRYTRRPGAPTVVSGTHDQKVGLHS